MDGFTGYKTAAGEEIPDAVAVMDPVPCRPAVSGDALDMTRQRVQQEIFGHRGRPATRSTGVAASCTPALGLLKHHQLAQRLRDRVR